MITTLWQIFSLDYLWPRTFFSLQPSSIPRMRASVLADRGFLAKGIVYMYDLR